ncbi:germin-like protein 1-1 [Selaginella moellendorffii]|uniref:germin-like protein 1-1 n=1 Tax=Selaginella moellendorffii TaxID=88036 RepID=UPI000D1C8A29|nr:germin-like protein 1-1 [Selaginella moellendorffii]|eukprot:XP_024526167.1 germin-like protein 1-1 [Selaginella moellendorffii]
MALNSSLLLLLLCYVLAIVNAADPDPLQDFCVAHLSKDLTINGFPCKDASAATTEDFIFAALKNPGNTSNPFGVGVVPGSVREYPGLNTLGISIARLDFAVGGLTPPHTHPRASEIIYVVTGSLYAGFVSTDNRVFARVITEGEVMMFPRGLIHWQLNVGKSTATGIVTLNSQSPGFQFVANSLFGSGDILDEVLVKSFFLDENTVREIKSIFASSS